MRMSLGGAVLIALIVLIRFAGLDRLPKRLFPALWCLALLRLLTPLSVPVPAGLALPLPERPMAAPADTSAPVIQGGDQGAEAVQGTVSPSPRPAASPFSAPQGAKSFPLLPTVWAAVGLGLGLYFVLSRTRFRRELRTAVPVENEFAARWLAEQRPRRRVELRELAGLPSPLTYGIVRPVILVPRGFDWSDRSGAEYVLYHEYTHIRRFDAALKLLMAAALCLHWFNPLVWVMYFLFDRDLELACDEAVLRRFGAGRRRDYAETIIGMEEKRALPAPFGSFFSMNTAEERIRAIMKFNKNSVIALTLALMLVLVGTITVFATAGGGNQTPDEKDTADTTDATDTNDTADNNDTTDAIDTSDSADNNDTADAADTADKAGNNDTTEARSPTGDTTREFSMDWAIDHTGELSDRELIVFAARSDGAYAEAAESELVRRFIADPYRLLNALAAEQDANVDNAVYLLAGELYWEERGDALDSVSKPALTAQEAAILEAITEQYNKIVESNQ